MKKFHLQGTRRKRGSAATPERFDTHVIATEAEEAMSTARYNWANTWQDIVFKSAVEVD